MKPCPYLYSSSFFVQSNAVEECALSVNCKYHFSQGPIRVHDREAYWLFKKGWVLPFIQLRKENCMLYPIFMDYLSFYSSFYYLLWRLTSRFGRSVAMAEMEANGKTNRNAKGRAERWNTYFWKGSLMSSGTKQNGKHDENHKSSEHENRNE